MTARRTGTRVVICCGMLALATCSDSAPSEPTALGECGDNVTMTVSAGLTPTFSWAPACKIYYLDVTATGTDQEMWAFASQTPENVAGPGVVYGTLPQGARTIDGPVPLVAGTEYYVFIVDRSDRLVAETRFTPR